MYEEEYFDDVVIVDKVAEQNKIDEERIKKLKFSMQEMKLTYNETKVDKLIIIYDEILEAEAKLGLSLFRKYISLEEFIQIKRFRKKITWVTFLFFIVRIYKKNC